jgi:hypothetical protein
MTSLPEYRERLRHLGSPSLLQAQAYALHIASARSWYKHLHVISGFGGFCFYLDPSAGKDVWWDAVEGVRVVARMPEDTPVHYSWQTTAAAIEQFGYLNFCRYHPAQSSSAWITDGAQVFSVPDELLQQTRVECTALIHPHSESLRHVFRLPNYRQLLDPEIIGQLTSPEEKRLAEIIRRTNDDYNLADDFQHEYAGLVAGVRNRQLSNIVKAIDNLRNLMM